MVREWGEINELIFKIKQSKTIASRGRIVEEKKGSSVPIFP